MRTFNNPILFIGDNPTLPGGLSRIGRDLSTLVSTMPEFRVAYLGRGMGQKASLPYTLYDHPETGQWGEDLIEHVWNDFSQGQDGIIMTLDDITRRHWFANPVGLPEGLQKFLGHGRTFQKWGYFPVDGVGPNGTTLPYQCCDSLQRYDRILGATDFASHVLSASVNKFVDYIPHGVDFSHFKPRGDWPGFLKEWSPGEQVVGCVMANQSRKDWPVAFAAFSLIQMELGNRVRFWCHTSTPIAYWNLYALALDYGVQDSVIITSNLSDHRLSQGYSACACTLLPSGGEGFGYPVVESMACGTPCIVSNYSGSSTLVPNECVVAIDGYRVDTAHNMVRAILSADKFYKAALVQMRRTKDDPVSTKEAMVGYVDHLNWPKLAGVWKRWFREGLA